MKPARFARSKGKDWLRSARNWPVGNRSRSDNWLAGASNRGWEDWLRSARNWPVGNRSRSDNWLAGASNRIEPRSWPPELQLLRAESTVAVAVLPKASCERSEAGCRLAAHVASLLSKRSLAAVRPAASEAKPVSGLSGVTPRARTSAQRHLRSCSSPSIQGLSQPCGGRPCRC